MPQKTFRFIYADSGEGGQWVMDFSNARWWLLMFDVWHHCGLIWLNVISDRTSVDTHTSNSVFLNQAVNKLLRKALWHRRRWQNGGGLNRGLVRIQTANVFGYMLVNTAVNHSVDEGRGCVCQSACQHFHASPILGEVMPEEVVGSQFDGFLWRD